MSQNESNFGNSKNQMSTWAKIIFVVMLAVVVVAAGGIVIKYMDNDTIENEQLVMEVEQDNDTDSATHEDDNDAADLDDTDVENLSVQETPSVDYPDDAPDLGGALAAAANGDIAEIVENVGDAVVGISNMGNLLGVGGEATETEIGYGSGVIITDDGYIITNYHVIDGANSILVTTSTDEEYIAAVVGVYSDMDLAVLKIEASDLSVMPIGSSDDLQLGELAVAIGNPLGAEYGGSVTAGIISGMDREVTVDGRTNAFIQTDAAINPGNSGGALLNGDGELIGITSVKTTSVDVEGMGFAIPISDALPIIEELIENGFIEKPILGISGGMISELQAEYYEIPVGFMVNALVEDGAADVAGIKEGDIITHVNDEAVSDIDVLSKIISEDHDIGDELHVKVWRDGEELEFDATLKSNKTS